MKTVTMYEADDGRLFRSKMMCREHEQQFLRLRTAKQREDEFRADLNALLEKHKAELDITDDGKPYGMQIGIAVVTMMGVWDAAGNQTAEYTEFRI